MASSSRGDVTRCAAVRSRASPGAPRAAPAAAFLAPKKRQAAQRIVLRRGPLHRGVIRVMAWPASARLGRPRAASAATFIVPRRRDLTRRRASHAGSPSRRARQSHRYARLRLALRRYPRVASATTSRVIATQRYVWTRSARYRGALPGVPAYGLASRGSPRAASAASVLVLSRRESTRGSASHGSLRPCTGRLGGIFPSGMAGLRVATRGGVTQRGARQASPCVVARSTGRSGGDFTGLAVVRLCQPLRRTARPSPAWRGCAGLAAVWRGIPRAASAATLGSRQRTASLGPAAQGTAGWGHPRGASAPLSKKCSDRSSFHPRRRKVLHRLVRRPAPARGYALHGQASYPDAGRRTARAASAASSHAARIGCATHRQAFSGTAYLGGAFHGPLRRRFPHGTPWSGWAASGYVRLSTGPSGQMLVVAFLGTVREA